ncbi:hypothetical protein KDA_09140 [Dictyobacter alpinus]|uniref:Glycosyltransferase RgtA/B/C/D-like domain-containing protein n=1 Tax=Dictyobacter alpinus TaxID=2014873 RepID=A0A402B245_9CHLR|nr:flippase activity-associated protein Agl23 [Dictyobacter alpinus]GCE25430.1 hypothetical protein KDA_09140 [Dictyobacter alpinus]
MKSYENKPKEEIDAPDGLVSEENVSNGGDNDITTIDHVPAAAEEPAEPTMVQDEEIDLAAPQEEDLPEEDGEPVAPRHFWPPTRDQLWTGIAFWGVVILGALLRFWGLGDKPLHHDESLHAYFSLVLMHNNMENWLTCAQTAATSCYRYDPLTHGPFQFHIIAFIYKICQLLQVPDHGINTTTVRIAAATLGTALVGLPYFLRDYIGRVGAWLGCFLLAVSPSMVYYSRFAREDIYMAFFTLLMIVAVARYIRDRQAWWLLIAGLAFTLSYATKEATFLSIAIFGSFLGALIIWELGVRIPFNLGNGVSEGWKKYMPATWAPVLTLVYFGILGIIAKIFFGKLKELSIFITSSTANTHTADIFVGNLKRVTISTLPWLGIALAVVIGILLFLELKGYTQQGRRGLALRINPRKQPVLDTILTMPWTHWFFALVCSWFLFVVLFTVLFTNLPAGIGDGIWQGLYYWLQQQQVARGGQPWYYYFMLIPLYEQIGVVFGLVGIVRCLLRPTRFRLFLVYWFVGNVFIYTWAGEKMPWLMIHMTMPLMLLAAVALEPAVLVLLQVLKNRWQARASQPITEEKSIEPDGIPGTGVNPALAGAAPSSPRRRNQLYVSIATVALAFVLLIPTLQNMFQVTFVHYADAPHEMMIYVQTSTDINTVMDKVDALDKKLYKGSHQLPIGLVDDATWPFAWYLRDYKNVCFNFPDGCSSTAQNLPVIISSGDKMANMQYQYRDGYQFHQYRLRTQWDQGYMPPACKPSAGNPCEPQAYVGVGPWLWLSYGDNPPSGAKFDLGRAVNNVWNWWWQRKAFGSTDGSYDMGIFIKNDVSSETGVKP